MKKPATYLASLRHRETQDVASLRHRETQDIASLRRKILRLYGIGRRTIAGMYVKRPIKKKRRTIVRLYVLLPHLSRTCGSPAPAGEPETL